MEQNGQKILCEIDQKAQAVRDNIARLNEQTGNLLLELEDFQKQETTQYLRLASFKARENKEDGLSEQLSHAEREAFRILQERDKALKKLDQKAQAIEADLRAKEDERLKTSEKASELNEQLEELRIKTLGQIMHEEEYRTLSSLVDETEHQIERVTYKIPLIEEDQQQKMQAYHQDVLFMHLWQAGFGSSDYKQKGLLRALDKRVARIANYDDARRNYSVLVALPQKFKDHLQMLERKLDESQDSLETYIHSAVLKAGGDKIESQLITVEETIEAHDRDIQALEERLQALRQQRHEIITGKDPLSHEAQTFLDLFLTNQSLAHLKREAAASASPEDDDIVSSLFEIDRSKNDVEKRLSEYQSLILNEEKRLHDIQSVRHKYKERGYDQRSGKRNGAAFSSLLGQFLGNVLTSEVFWRAVGNIFEEVLDEFDLDDVLEFDDDRHKRRRRRHRKHHKRHSKHHKRHRRRKYRDDDDDDDD